jgi:2-dehydropantoate 2-reductase
LLDDRTQATERRLQLHADAQLFQHTFPLQNSRTASPISRLIVTTKAPTTESALRPFLPFFTPQTLVLFLQNGMGAESFLLQEKPYLTMLHGITTDGVFRKNTDELVLAGLGETWIGAQNEPHTDAAKQLVQELAAIHPRTFFANDILQRRWLKLAINCVINPLTAIYRCRNGEILHVPEIAALLQPLCHELAEVMQAEGIEITEQQLRDHVVSTAQKTAANISSMHADILARRLTEIHFMNGFIIAHAQQHKLSVPLNNELFHKICALTA